ncbi:Uncharacterised protein [Klebsiella pneumoniae]|nr:Uncharacterised protein [Klebsiella pneumoniae]
MRKYDLSQVLFFYDRLWHAYFFKKILTKWLLAKLKFSYSDHFIMVLRAEQPDVSEVIFPSSPTLPLKNN